MFRLALIDITNDDLLNDFINDIFGYDFDLKRKEYVYIQYKVLGDNIILNSDENSIYINVKKEYDKYKSGNRDKLCLLSSLLFTKDNNEKIEIINSLFSDKIKNIFSHYFL